MTRPTAGSFFRVSWPPLRAPERARANPFSRAMWPARCRPRVGIRTGRREGTVKRDKQQQAERSPTMAQLLSSSMARDRGTVKAKWYLTIGILGAAILLALAALLARQADPPMTASPADQGVAVPAS